MHESRTLGEFQCDKAASRSDESTFFFLQVFIVIFLTPNMVVNDFLYLRSQIFLSDVESVVINEDHFINLFGLVLCLKLIPEEEIVLRYVTVSEMSDDLKLAEELITIAVDHWNVENAALLRIVVAESKGTDH